MSVLLSSSSVSTSSVAGSLSIYLYIHSVDIYGVPLRAGYASWSGDTSEEKTLLPLGTHIPAPFGVRPLLPTPCLHAGRLRPTSYPWRLITLLSKLESKTNTGLPGLLEPGFCSPGQEAGQQAAAPLCLLPPGAQGEPGKSHSALSFSLCCWHQEPRRSRNSQPFPLTLFYGALLTLL